MDKNSFSVELLRAASSCGQSLQKALALPVVASLCSELTEALHARTWKPGMYTRFAVQEPKLREIFAPDFADRVVEAWLVDLVEEPLSRLFIEDTYANRRGKGTHAAINKAQKLMRSPGHEWCLQLDVRSFFTSIHRPTLLRSWIDFLNGIGLAPEYRELAVYISTALLKNSPLENFHAVKSSRPLLDSIPSHKCLAGSPPDTGLPIGSVASQHFANFYLNDLDHFIKHELRGKGYVRYMDDLLLFGPNRAVLLVWRDVVAEYLKNRLRLSLHTGKELFSKSEQGIEYLGYRVYPHYLHVCSRTVSALKARLDFFKHLFQPERFPFCQRPVRGSWQVFLENAGTALPLLPEWPLLKRMEGTINSYYGIMGHAQSYKLRKVLYHKHFGLLRSFFHPADAGYTAIHTAKRFLRY